MLAISLTLLFLCLIIPSLFHALRLLNSSINYGMQFSGGAPNKFKSDLVFSNTALSIAAILIACMPSIGQAQDKCNASHMSHYGSFGDPVTDRGSANRGPLIFDNPQAALDAAVQWVTLLDSAAVFASSCGMDGSWRLGALVEETPSNTSYAIYTDVAGPYCSWVIKDVTIGFVFCGHDQRIEISLSGSTEIRPADTGGDSTVTFIAKVADGANPKPGVPVSFSVDVTPFLGGHEHHDANRPKGSLSRTEGTTDANGEVRLTFIAPEVAGTHTIKAICTTCSNSPATKEIQVKVPDLLPISPNPPQNADGSHVYALTSVDKIHEGDSRYHKNQYYLTEQARQNLRALTESFSAAGWGTVALNDASLFWGGRYDINGNWVGPHQGHRDGREIDISFTRASNPVSISKQKVFYKKFCEDKGVEAPFSILHHFVKVPHFHVYLGKQKACNRTEN